MRTMAVGAHKRRTPFSGDWVLEQWHSASAKSCGVVVVCVKRLHCKAAMSASQTTA